MHVADEIESIKNLLPDGVRLIAVSKTKPAEMIMEAYEMGHRIFGENKVQELTEKYKVLPKDIEWHMIGHLQTNKVKFIAPFVDFIHGVDSEKLLHTINREALKNSRIIRCLLQVKIASEDSKFGLSQVDAEKLLYTLSSGGYGNVNLVGLMGMATNTENEDVIRNEFYCLKEFFNKMKSKYFMEKNDFVEISMGMSNDFQIAVAEGATMVRIGSSIFGVRNYSKK